MSEYERILKMLRSHLQEAGDSDRAEKEKAYMKSKMQFYGVSKPEVTRIAKLAKSKLSQTSKSTFVLVANNLWDSIYFEERTLALVIASQHLQIFNLDDIEDIFENWINTANNWAHTDEFSIRVVGEMSLQYESIFIRLSDWTLSNHLWTQRASLVSHLPTIRAGNAHTDFLLSSSIALLHNDNFFIKKAIGWVLRELWDYSPKKAEVILHQLGPEIARLSLKEATRKMPLDKQKEFRKILK